VLVVNRLPVLGRAHAAADRVMIIFREHARS
jgi:hypothetical protein